MTLNKRINVFINLGELLLDFVKHLKEAEYSSVINKAILNSYKENPWFTEDNIMYALKSIAIKLTEENFNKWLKPYDLTEKEARLIAVIMAGNIPLVGFHDFLCVLISGNKFLGKLSAKDKFLLPALTDILIKIEPDFKERIFFAEDSQLSKFSFDAVIATGSNNTARYFEYYFGKYPHIIRKSRGSVAVLNGNETNDDLKKLGIDIFQYFGIGCRNVSKIFVPQNYDFTGLFEAFADFDYVIHNQKYLNNYKYHKVIFIMNKILFKDNGFLILNEDTSIASPVSVIHYEYYENIEVINNQLEQNKEKIQCIVSNTKNVKNCIPFGTSQQPELWDYADGVDTIKFLLEL